MAQRISTEEINALKWMHPSELMGAVNWDADPKDKRRVTYVSGDQQIGFYEGKNTFWMWKNQVSGDFGTIIDLAKQHCGGNYLSGLNLLCEYVGNATANENKSTQNQSTSLTQSLPHQSKTSPKTEDTKKSPDEVKKEFMSGAKMWRVGDPVPDYLASRGITHLSQAFDASFGISPSGNLRFMHRGFEDGKFFHAGISERGPTMKDFYTTRGTNGVWLSSTHFRKGGVAVIVENQIDAMSYDKIHDYPDDHIYLSLRAGIEKTCADILKKLFDAGWFTRVVIATDNDAAGLTYAGKVLTELKYGRVKGSNHKYYGGMSAGFEAPVDGHEDWNEVIRPPLRNNSSYRGRGRVGAVPCV